MRIGRPAGCRGFTYLWLLFMVALGGVALAALGQRQQLVQQREREAELRFRGEAIAKAIGGYMRASPAGANSLPQRLEDLLEDRRSGTVQRHLRRLYADPFTGRADWQLIVGHVAVKKPRDQDEAASEALEKKKLPGPPGQLGSAAVSEEQGAPMVSGIVGVSSRSRAILLATGHVVGVAEAASSPAKARKPRVSELQFTAQTEVLASE
ncbi:type II secretion system GspH family protein [Paucibacter sp. B2R-40]|uniref:type II secretion system protein n=1 Tax=Paucibacter sp. B2R-40 TaxID=2893554 RepID=UPI0021E3B5F1|nr:type II secretion system protein [Paucibacter sp. B2R-40]MCV2354915.1 type II secretion system GspH family protein [Paucibacter sp. B2R-40]